MPPVALRPLGSNETLVSALGFGAMGLSFGYGKTEDNEERLKVLDRALELGSTFWDTSDGCKSTIKLFIHIKFDERRWRQRGSPQTLV